MDISTLIKEQYPGMNKTRRRIADLILEYPEKCSFLSLKELSELTNTTQVTILSFCRDLGYKSYMEFKQELQSFLIARIEVRDRMKLVHSATKSESDLYEQLIKSTHQMIDATYANNSVDTILQFVQKLIDAKHVFVTAHNVTAKPARLLTSQLISEGIHAHFLDIQNRDEIYNLLTMWPAGECRLVAVGISPCGKSTIAITDFCARIGMDVLCITDKTTSQLARNARVSIVCSAQMMNLFNSLTSIYMMTDVINAFLSSELDKRQIETDAQKQQAAHKRGLLDEYFLG